MAADAAVTPVESRPSVLSDYWEMTKPSITLLVLVTTAGAMVWAADGLPPLELTRRDAGRHGLRVGRRRGAEPRASTATSTG